MRDQLTPEWSYRLSIDAFVELLDFSLRGADRNAGHAERLIPVRRYLVAAMCTLARHDAIFAPTTCAIYAGIRASSTMLSKLNPTLHAKSKQAAPAPFRHSEKPASPLGRQAFFQRDGGRGKD